MGLWHLMALKGLGTLRDMVYLNTEEPTFLGFLNMISLYKS